MEALANINGTQVPLREATVSALDRGFLFGDAVYEVLRVYRSRPWLEEEHFRRLAHSLEAVRIRGVNLDRLRERMGTARSLRVRTEAGTSFAASFDSSLDWIKTSGLISPRYWSNLPAGEVFTTPARVDGTFVCDGTAGDHFCGKYGDLRGTPLVLEIRDGRLVEARCARADLQQEFWEYCHTDENSNRVGELAFGTNLSLSEMIGVLLQDEKLPGVHLAFGDPYGSQTHADWQSQTHVDVLTRHCDVWIDDDQVLAKGRYLMEPLGLA